MPPVDTAELQPRLPDGLDPTWRFDHDFRCPSCRYNVRMLRDPRCPECGLVFRWQQLLGTSCARCGESLVHHDGSNCPHCDIGLNWAALFDAFSPSARDHYEYADRPLWPAIMMAFAILRPVRFWGAQSLELPPVTSRLVAFRRVAWALSAVGLLLAFVSLIMSFQWRVGRAWGTELAIESWIDLAALSFILPLTTTIALPLFGPTLARFRIRREQMLRVTAYSGGLVGWLGTVIIAESAWLLLSTILDSKFAVSFPSPFLNFARGIEVLVQADLFRRAIAGGWAELGDVGLTLAISFMNIAWLVSVTTALRRFLRIDWWNIIALLLSTQAIGMLMLLIVTLDNTLYTGLLLRRFWP